MPMTCCRGKTGQERVRAQVQVQVQVQVRVRVRAQVRVRVRVRVRVWVRVRVRVRVQMQVQVQAVTGMRGGAGAMKSRCPRLEDTLFRTGALVPSVRRAWLRMRCRR